MRSWPSALLALALAACGADTMTPGGDDGDDGDGDACDQSYLRYQNFGEPFMLSWCRGCHGAAVPEGMRQDAPLDVNFDSESDLVKHQERILVRATGTAPTMPPAGGPAPAERALLAEWMSCGMK